MAFFSLYPATTGYGLAQRKKFSFLNWTLNDAITYSWRVLTDGTSLPGDWEDPTFFLKGVYSAGGGVGVALILTGIGQ